MATLGRWSGGSATHPTESWVSPNGLGTTQDRNDGSAYSWSSSSARLTLPSSDLADGYLVIARLHYTITHNNRHTHNARFTTNSGTGDFLSSTTGGYSRNTANNENFVLTWAVVNNPSASYSLDYEWKRDQGDGTTAGSVTDWVLDVVPLYYSDIALYSSTNSDLLGGTTPVTQPLTTTVLEGTNITRSGNVITVTGDNKRYLIFGSNYTEGRGGRTQRWVGGEYDGTQDRGAMACIYHRDTGTDENGIAFSDIIETVTASRTIEQFIYRGDGVANNQGGANIDGNNPAVGAHAMAVIELNDSCEVIRSSNASASSQNIDLGEATNVDISAINTVDFNDSGSFTKVSATAVNAEQAMDALLGANLGAASRNVSSSTRYTGRARFTVNGTEDADTFHGNYGRQNQSSADTFGWSANPIAFVGLSSGDDIGVSANEIGDAGDFTVQPAWAGFWGINLDTMEAAASDTAITPPAGSHTFTGYAPTVAVTDNHVAEPGTGTISSSGSAPTAGIGINITVPAGSLTLEGYAPPTVLQPSLFGLQLTGYAPTVVTEEGIDIAIPAGTLTLTGYAPALELSVEELPGSGTLTITGYAPTVQVTENMVIEVPTGSLTVTGHAPTVLAGDNRIAEPTLGTLDLNTFVPTIVWTDNHVRGPPQETLTLTGLAPSVLTGDNKVTQPDVGTLTITGHAPTVAVTDFQVTEPPSGTLTATGYAPTLSYSWVIEPPSGDLTLTGAAPAVLSGDSRVAQPPTGTLTLTGYATTVTAGADEVAEPTLGTLNLTGYAPSVFVGDFIAVPTGTLTLEGYAPPTVLQPSDFGLSLTGYEPTILVGDQTNITVPTGSLTVTGDAPAIEIFIENAPGTLQIDGHIPALTITPNDFIRPTIGTVTIQGYEPLVVIPENAIGVQPGAGTLSLQGHEPTVYLSSYYPDTGVISIIGHEPTLVGDLEPVARKKKGGRPKKRQRLYVVTIDGQDFIVNNMAQVEAIMAQVRQIAEEQAETDDRITPISITVKTKKGTESRSSGILSEVRKTKQAVAKAIEFQATRLRRRDAIDREIGQLLVEKIEREDEEAILILLM